MAYVTPSRAARAAILAPLTRLYSRAEFYERDGRTPFKPNDMTRVIDGSVSVDMTRDERRAFDLTLENYDDALDIRKTNIWYNKIVKIFKGVYVSDITGDDIRIAVTGNSGTALTKKLINSTRQLMMNTGADLVRAFGRDITMEDIEDFNILVSATGTTYPSNISLLKSFMDSGRDVITISTQTNGLPLITASVAEDAQADVLVMPTGTGDAPGAFGWDFWQYDLIANQMKPTGLAPGVEVTARRADGTPAVMFMRSKVNSEGSWTHIHMDPPRTEAEISEADEFIQLLRVIISSVKSDLTPAFWETQIGEFEIDTIKTQSFPRTMQLSGRDRVKTCMGSKLEAATAYKKGSKIPDIIRSLASNAGITKFRFEPMNKTLAAQVNYDLGTSRWEVMKAFAESITCELYFDGQGYLVLKPQEDVAKKTVHETFTTGETGNIVEFSKTSDDSEMFNVIIVSSESTGDDTPPIIAVAKNTNTNSATSITQVGQRAKLITSSVIKKKADAQKLADTTLKVSGLHSYSIDISTLQFFWLEAGMVIQFNDPYALTTEPSRFLLSSFSIPLGLGTMSMNAKRLVIAS